MRPIRVPPAELNISAFPPVLHDWVIKGLGMSSLVYATGHIKDLVPLIEKRRGLSPGGQFPPSFIHQVIIITGLNKLYNCICSRHEDDLRCRQGVKPQHKKSNEIFSRKLSGKSYLSLKLELGPTQFGATYPLLQQSKVWPVKEWNIICDFKITAILIILERLHSSLKTG